jgi:hypothetical protein
MLTRIAAVTRKGEIMRKLAPLVGLVVALAFTGTAGATPPTAASGSVIAGPPTVTVVKVVGGNTFQTYVRSGVFTGDFVGSFSETGTRVVHADGSFEDTHVVTCECTVAGRSGTVIFNAEGKGTLFPVVNAESDLETISATDGLSGLHALLEVVRVDATVTYSGTYHFDPR